MHEVKVKRKGTCIYWKSMSEDIHITSVLAGYKLNATLSINVIHSQLQIITSYLLLFVFCINPSIIIKITVLSIYKGRIYASHK